MNNNTQTTKVLSVFSLVMITIVSVDTIRNLPSTSLFGSSLFFFYTLATLFFLIPTALVSAELASAWPKQGGVYVWVKEAFGIRAGFVAIWFQWVENVVWYPTILSFIAGTIGYLISPQLANSKAYLITDILVVFWVLTIINLYGMKTSARFSNFCAIAGLLLPMAVIIGLGVAWVAAGKPMQIHFTETSMLPNWHDKELWVAMTGVVLSFCGMEIATVHARDVVNPKKSFPKALIISAIIILATLISGALSIAIVVPRDQISLVAGIMQAFNTFFIADHMHWMLPIIAFVLVVGSLGGISNWIVAPIKGLLVAGQDGNLPDFLQRENKRGAPSTLLIIQALIVSALAFVFNLMPSVNGSYWLLTALAAQLYMFMYIIMFVTGIWMRYKYPEQPRPYHIPGGKFGMWLVAGAGIIGSTVTVIVGFIPPGGIKVGTVLHYDVSLIIGLIVMTIPPFIFYQFCYKKNAKISQTGENSETSTSSATY